MTAECYGGNATRKRKLLDKRDKKARRQEPHAAIRKVDIPQEAFIAALKVDV